MLRKNPLFTSLCLLYTFYFSLYTCYVHNIYTTKTIILKTIPIGEANRLFFLFTEDLGLIKATAQGVRLFKSKLRGHLQEFYLSKISLVRGKELWRITSSEAVFQSSFLKDKNKIYLFKNIFSVLLRLIHGEEKNQFLFDCIEKFYVFLYENEITEENTKNIESLVMLRILNSLGYLKKTEGFTKFCENNDITYKILEDFSILRSKAVFEINSTLKETHL